MKLTRRQLKKIILESILKEDFGHRGHHGNYTSLGIGQLQPRVINTSFSKQMKSLMSILKQAGEFLLSGIPGIAEEEEIEQVLISLNKFAKAKQEYLDAHKLDKHKVGAAADIAKEKMEEARIDAIGAMAIFAAPGWIGLALKKLDGPGKKLFKSLFKSQDEKDFVKMSQLKGTDGKYMTAEQEQALRERLASRSNLKKKPEPYKQSKPRKGGDVQFFDHSFSSRQKISAAPMAARALGNKDLWNLPGQYMLLKITKGTDQAWAMAVPGHVMSKLKDPAEYSFTSLFNTLAGKKSKRRIEGKEEWLEKIPQGKKIEIELSSRNAQQSDVKQTLAKVTTSYDNGYFK